MRIRRSLLVPTVAAAFVLGVAACGGGHGDHEGNANVAPDARVIEVDARLFEFEPDTIRVDAGEDVAIELTSEDAFHDFEVEDGDHVVGAESGDTETGGLRIDDPGRYTFFCTVSGHRAAGMEGTLIVR